MARESPLLAHSIWSLSMNTWQQVVPLKTESMRLRLSSLPYVCTNASLIVWLRISASWALLNQFPCRSDELLS
jgi:hypothetical protein